MSLNFPGVGRKSSSADMDGIVLCRIIWAIRNKVKGIESVLVVSSFSGIGMGEKMIEREERSKIQMGEHMQRENEFQIVKRISEIYIIEPNIN